MNPYLAPGKTERRRGLTKLEWVERIWRDLVPAIAVCIAAVAVIGLSSKADKVKVVADQQAQGRKVAIDVLCGGLYGAELAGQATLKNSLPGFPPPTGGKRERALRAKAAKAYATIISQAVIEQAGVQGADVLRIDGTIDCDRLRVAARAAPAPTP